MSTPRNRAAVLLIVAAGLSTSACADRLEPPVPETHQRSEQMRQWSESRAEPYGIPERQLRAYAYAAHRAEQEAGCAVGWPTIAALGAVLSDHGRAASAQVTEAGATTTELLDLPSAPEPVADTDGGRLDGSSEHDVAVGPLQIMPSRWEQYAVAAEPGAEPDPHHIDDAALTTAHMLCLSGDLSSPEGWDTAVKEITADPEFVKAVHAKATEYSR